MIYRKLQFKTILAHMFFHGEQTGVIDQHIQRPRDSTDRSHHLPDIFGTGQVGLVMNVIVVFDACLGPRATEYLVARGEKMLCECAADPTARAGDQNFAR